MKRILIVLIVLAALGAGLFAFYAERAQAPGPSDNAPLGKVYSNSQYGISFTYPEVYVLTEGERGDAHRYHYAIVLVRTEDAEPRVDSEGPTAITFDIYQNNLDKQTVVGWMKGSNNSNFKIGPGTYASTTVAGIEAVNYRWSGLYEGETTALRHGDNIIAASVTWLTPEDANIAAYRDILASMKFSLPAPTPGLVSVAGALECLPHKNTSGPQTTECAYGLKDDAGRHYGLRDTDPTYKNLMGVPTGARVTVTGEFMPKEDAVYDSVGVIEIQSIAR